MTARYDDTALEALLGAYALDACEPDETAAIEEMLDRRPDLLAEADRLSRAVAWVGATGALAPPDGLRASLLDAARERVGRGDGPAAVYRAATARVGDTIDAFDEADGDAPTPNGLCARDLIVHLTAQHSGLAAAVGDPVVPEITEAQVEPRTDAFLDRYRSAPIDEVRSLWHRSVDAVRRWAEDPSSHGNELDWAGLHWRRESALVGSAFELWVHREDLRAVRGLPREVPPPEELGQMADLSMRTLPLGLLVKGNARPGRTARVVLTGEGGGEWLLGMDAAEVAPGVVPDVTLTTDVVDWCLVVGERLAPEALPCTVEGDESLAADRVAAAPAFATL